MIFKNDQSAAELNGFIDAGSQVDGELSFEASFRVDGRLKGSVKSGGQLIIGAGGLVEADLEVGELLVSGTLRGSVKAVKRVRIAASGKLYGEIDTPALILEEGSFFEGSCTMANRGQAARPSAERPTVVQPIKGG